MLQKTLDTYNEGAVDTMQAFGSLDYSLPEHAFDYQLAQLVLSSFPPESIPLFCVTSFSFFCFVVG